MRNCLIILVAALLVASCDKAVTIDHHITAEFPVQETLPQVSVLFAEEGEADILVTSEGAKSKLQGLVEQSVQGGKVIRYKALAIFTGTLTEDTLEETFWAEPSLEWIVVSDAEEIPGHGVRAGDGRSPNGTRQGCRCTSRLGCAASQDRRG